MKDNKLLIAQLHSMECYELVRIIDEDYYRQMIACKADTDAVSQVILDLIDEILDVEAVCAKIERYDLAIICRDKRVNIADQICLNSLV